LAAAFRHLSADHEIHLGSKPLFAQISTSMDTIKAAINGTNRQQITMSLAFLPILLLFWLGCFRLTLGIANGRPIIFLLLTLIAFAAAAVFFMLHLYRLPIKITVATLLAQKPKYSEMQRKYLIKKEPRLTYFLFGAAALSLSFKESCVIDQGHTRYTGSSSCGSAGCSSCGGGGGCGGGCGG
jgi:uncharacterized membrane protein YgcG